MKIFARKRLDAPPDAGPHHVQHLIFLVRNGTQYGLWEGSPEDEHRGRFRETFNAPEAMARLKSWAGHDARVLSEGLTVLSRGTF